LTKLCPDPRSFPLVLQIRSSLSKSLCSLSILRESETQTSQAPNQTRIVPSFNGMGLRLTGSWSWSWSRLLPLLWWGWGRDRCILVVTCSPACQHHHVLRKGKMLCSSTSSQLHAKSVLLGKSSSFSIVLTYKRPQC
jgi:hypothetical protein